MSDVTEMLYRAENGDRKVAEELLPIVYDELRKLAAHRLSFCLFRAVPGGFSPPMQFAAGTFAGARVQPLGHPTQCLSN
jgi:hypothetical protein